MFSECVCEVFAQNTPQIFLYSVLKLLLFKGAQKRTVFVCQIYTPFPTA